MPKEKPAWRKFDKLKFDSKRFSKKAKKVESATTRHAHRFLVKRWDNIADVRQTIIGWVLLVATLVVAVGLQMTWFQKGYQTEAAVPGGTYAEAVLGDIETLNPIFASTGAELSASQLMFSSLYSYDTQGRIKNDLATSLVADGDGKVYTVKIKSGVKWHDEQMLTASDVMFTINLIRNPDTRSSLGSAWRGIKVEAIDDTTIQFTLPAQIAAFPHALTFPVLPEHILKDIAPGSLRQNDFSSTPIGSGPFKLRLLQPVDKEKGMQIVHMSGFDHYHGGSPRLNRFQLHTFRDREDILTALKTGEVNGAADLSSDDTKSIDTDRYVVLNLPIKNGVYALFNSTSPTLGDKSVRQALRLAVNTEEVRKQLSVPVEKLDLPFFTDQVNGADALVAPQPDVAKAAEILDSAGWKLDGAVRKKGDQVLTIRLVTIKDSDYEKAVDVLSSQWQAVGVKVETLVADPADASQDITQTILQARNYDVLVYKLMIGADPDVYAYWHSSQAKAAGRNLSNYSNVMSDDALASARTRSEPALRSAKYLSFARQWLDDAPAIGLYQSNFVYAHSKRAVTLPADSVLVTPQSRYADVIYWTVDRGTVYKTP